MERLFERVWDLTRRVPRGRVTTYGSLARQLGKSGGGQGFPGLYKMGHLIHLVDVQRARAENLHGKHALLFDYSPWQ